MRSKNMKSTIRKTYLVLALALAAALLVAPSANAATPGITSTNGTAGTFNLTAQWGYTTQPDGRSVYTWGYGCAAGSAPAFLPAMNLPGFCNAMQLPLSLIHI